MHFSIRFSDDNKAVWVTADKEMVFGADAAKVELVKAGEFYKLTVTSSDGAKKVFSPKGIEIVKAGETPQERISRRLEELTRDLGKTEQKPDTSEVSTPAVEQDIADFFASMMKGESSDDEEE